jgi:hypothetical protein
MANALREAIQQPRHKTEYDQDATRYQAANDLVRSKHAKIISHRAAGGSGNVSTRKLRNRVRP